MAEESSFFNDVNGDREYDMEQFATYFKQFLSNGLYHRNNVPALLVSKGTGLQTTVDAGSAYIEGFMYQNTESITFDHETADASNPRIDRIILRLDRNVAVRAINAVVKKGTPSTTPQPPTLERNDVVYEISLAQVRINAGTNSIASVKDERLDPSVAGLVSSLITVPTDGFIQEWNGFMAEMDAVKNGYEQQINNWISEGNQDKLDYQQQLMDWANQLDQQKAIYEQQWSEWFQDIQVENPAMGGMTISVSSQAPESPIANDIWIDTNA